MRPLTRSCFLLLFLGRVCLLALPFVLGICLPSLWSPPFPLHAPALTRFSLAKVRLSLTLTLPPHGMVLWTDGFVPFLFGKNGSGVLANCSPCGAEATLSFLQAQYAQVFPLKPAPFCSLLAGLGSTNKSAISLLLCDSRSVLATLSSPSFLLPQSFWQELSSLSSCSIRLQWVLGHLFFPGKDAADQLANLRVQLVFSAVPCSLSSYLSYLLFSFLGLVAYCLIYIFRHTGSLVFH